MRIRPTGNAPGGVTSIRTQLEIALCFCWGIAMHHHHITNRHPSHCMRETHGPSRAGTVYDPHHHYDGSVSNSRRIKQNLVPALVKDADGIPVHHGIVERGFDKLRAIVQMYVLDKQEARSCACNPTMYAFAVRLYMFEDELCMHGIFVVPQSITRTFEYHHCRATALTEEIKFGDASPVIRSNRDKIVFDEFEYDSTSMRRTTPLPIHHSCLSHVQPPHVQTG